MLQTLFYLGLILIALVFGYSPASPLVEALFERTIHFMPFAVFMTLFALFEMLIGVLFLVRGAERLVLPLLFLHMVMVCMPLVLLTGITWQKFLVPSLEGQYIIKNVVLIACAMGIAANLSPLKKKA